MIVRFLEILTEYISIVLCLNKVVNKRINIYWYYLVDFVSYMIIMFAVENIRFGKVIIFAYWYVYTKIRVVNTWKETIKPYVTTMCLIPMFQLVIYSVISMKLMKIFSVYSVGLIINIFIIKLFLVWKKKYLHILMNLVTKFRKIIFLVLLILLFKYLISYYLEYRMIESYFIDQIVICFLIISLMLILWINAENEKQHKAEELRAYQIYTKTFEDAVATIRMRQHEFDNHINAIKCMHYAIHDMEQLMDEQNKYCDKILQDNRYNKILKLNMSPILIGYLYSKFIAASALGVNIEYEVQDINTKDVAINDLIEIIGILFDNAVEALEKQKDKEMEVKLLNADDKFIIAVANVSSWKTNSEIEKFFEYGYSTKGKEHGIGLCRINDLARKYKSCIQVENIEKNEVNYLCFKVMI